MLQQPCVCTQLPARSHMASSRQERPADHGGYLFLGPASDALTQHLSAAGMGIVTSPSGVAMWSQGWKLCWEKPCFYCLRTRCRFHLPCSLLVWGFSSETPLFPTRAICVLTDSRRILRDGAYSSHGLREESSQVQNHVDGGLFPQRSSVFTSAAGPSSFPHRQPPQSLLFPPWGRAAGLTPWRQAFLVGL